MRFRSTLILAVLVAALGAYLWFVERPAVEKEEEKKTLLEVDREKVAGIVLEYPDARIELARKDGTWRVVAPRELDADQTVVTSLVGAIAEAELKKTIDAPEGLGPYGLEQPVAVVTLTLEDGTQLPRLAVGRTTPVGYSAYARRGDDAAVLVTTSAFHSGVKKELKDLRDKTVLPFQEDAVQEIRIEQLGKPEVVLRKNGNEWSVVKPAAAKADVTQVRSYLATLRAMRALSFVDETQSPPEAKYGLAPPRVSVSLLVGEGREERKLLVGAAVAEEGKKEIYVERGTGGPIFTVGDYLVASLAKKPDDFRDKTVLAFARDAAASVVVTDGSGASFTVEKRGDKWTLAEAGDAKVKDMMIERFVDDLRTLKGSDVASESGPEPQFGLDSPSLKIEVRGGDGASLGTILVAQPEIDGAKRTYATTAGGKTVYSLNDYALQRIDKKRADFLESAAPAADAAGGAADASAAHDEHGHELDAADDEDLEETE